MDIAVAEKYKCRNFVRLKHVWQNKCYVVSWCGSVGAHLAIDKIQIRIIFICLFLVEFVEG